MRVITGTARGRRLVTREGSETRPTPERVKEAIFDIVQFQVEGRRVLDAFAGSGQLGIEALSRGADHATFLDSSRESIQVIQKNLTITGLADKASVYQTDTLLYLQRRGQRYDLCFLDPPYRTGLLQQALPLCAAVMNPGGLILCEHPADEELPQSAGDFCHLREYRYGKIRIATFVHKDVSV
ncbi:16S rRNA (guanine(966)-N(2))-methyltransferase RsmD [Ruminococcaceae bacterium CPB6]|jgi:16S rRNA (guanine(966)-N(2))-methyltransferase RsmD|uniref:16S rRNA (Guanine(966)-N(2))-methyltransferase RsmD n=1 Tax=Caproicibacterium lactatifermentans TaxID=2666138 RepID=A0A859DPM0_9FIRM|nr:16S rRNA (guanine(966)-N(2))-methyltransferase RsmD [Ruminococcaceae bacterium CPB6]QKN23395.1 16S rRNA (guanine(966)-N(2))-methyltransferase RsmD [Caproicibacterium lactatifermentans]QKO29927.1 16S rRNA (guanine(966)-N(2))-methyltransferase RsmD [Caproicibacterium lactatifermentans]